MSCDRFEEWLPDHAMGRLAEERDRELEEHLASCASCSAYLLHVRELYDIPLPSHAAPTGGLEMAAPWQGRLRQVMTLGGFAAAALLIVNLPSSEVGLSPQPSMDEEQRLELTMASLRIQLPELPSDRASMGWVQSESEARLLSEYSGKPMLKQSFNSECPRCMAVVRLMEDPKHEPLLDEFVCFRSEVDGSSAASLHAGRAPEGELMLSLPAMFVRHDFCSSDLPQGYSNWEQVLADFASSSELEGQGMLGALEGETYDDVLRQMRSLPELMEQGYYNQVLAGLHSMSVLGSRYRTRFAHEAKRMETELLQNLEEVVNDLEERHRQGDEAEVQSMAQDLLRGLTDTPFSSRIQVLCE